MNETPKKDQTKGRLTLLAITMAFALPLALAWVIAMGPLSWRPSNTVNNGTLLQPPLLLASYGVTDADGKALEVNAGAGDWFLIVLHDTPCAEPCRSLVQAAERVRFAVGSDYSRVSLAMISPDDGGRAATGQRWRFPAGSRLVEALRRATGEPQLGAALLIADHQGRIVMVYPSPEDGYGVLKDLERLLRATGR